MKTKLTIANINMKILCIKPVTMCLAQQLIFSTSVSVLSIFDYARVPTSSITLSSFLNCSWNPFANDFMPVTIDSISSSNLTRSYASSLSSLSQSILPVFLSLASSTCLYYNSLTILVKNLLLLSLITLSFLSMGINRFSQSSSLSYFQITYLLVPSIQRVSPTLLFPCFGPPAHTLPPYPR